MFAGCGNSMASGAENVTLADCSFACAGDATELCGAGSKCLALLRLLELRSSDRFPTRPSQRLLEWHRAPASSHYCPLRRRLEVSRLLQVSTPADHESVYLLNPNSDSVNARVLTLGVPVPGNFTVEGCTEACFNSNFPLAGMEFAEQCCQLFDGSQPR